MPTLRGNKLNDADKREVLAAYIYRGTIENQRAHPDCVRQAGSRLPLITDARWLETTAFAVTKSGRLDRRVHHCTHNSYEIPEHRAILEKWETDRKSKTT